MDEPTSALDPISTSESRSWQWSSRKVHHRHRHPQHAAGRAYLRPTAFFLLGELVECGDTEQMFSTPDKRTEDYITGRFG